MRSQGVWIGCLVFLSTFLCAFSSGGQEPKRPLEEIVQHFAQKEAEYAAAFARYKYQLSIDIQERSQAGDVVGEFEEVLQTDFDPSGRRTERLLENPRVDLQKLGIKRLELEHLARVPLYVLRPEDVGEYDVTYVTNERIDEVNTFLFRLIPKHPSRSRKRLFEGVVWVDADKLDIVRAHGRMHPLSDTGPLGSYFQRMELFREPVDDYLFTTYIRADDVLSAIGEEPLTLRMVLRFSNFEPAREGSP